LRLTIAAAPIIARRGAGVVAIAAVSVIATAPPAAAHGTAGQAPTDWESRATSISPAVAGLSARVTDLGEHLEITSVLSEVLVLGYDGEPYLRIGPAGVWQNERSPAVFYNRGRTVTETLPAEYDAAADPEWRRAGGGRTFRWHDHRIHPMGDDRSFSWTVELEIAGRAVAVRGEVVPLARPSLLPLGAIGTVSALVAFGAGRRWPAAGLAAVLALLAAASGSVAVARWAASTERAGAKLAVAVWAFGAALGAIAVAARVARGTLTSRAPSALFAAGAITIVAGVALIPWLLHANLPATGPSGLWRAIVAAVLGAGAATTTIAARALRPR
jgi:hypothetical protein